jgi:hypothetical protein
MIRALHPRPAVTQSSEERRVFEEQQRNYDRKHDWLLKWVERFPLADHFDIPPAMNWRYHQEARMQ